MAPNGKAKGHPKQESAHIGRLSAAYIRAVMLSPHQSIQSLTEDDLNHYFKAAVDSVKLADEPYHRLWYCGKSTSL